MEEKIEQLKKSPENWELRCELVQQYYEAEQLDEAAGLISDAPEIPGDEESVIFAATVLGATDVESGITILDQYLEVNKKSAVAFQLRSELLERQEVESAEADEAAPAPRKLQPPGEEGGDDSDAHSLPSETATEVPLITRAQSFVGVEVEEGEIEHAHELDAEGRAFIVGEGGAVHAAEKKSDSGDKVGAIAIAVLINVLVLVALFLVKGAGVRKRPPQISVSSLAQRDNGDIESESMVKMQQKTASASTASEPVVSSLAFSNFAVPDVVNTANNLSMVGTGSGDMGFGMSMTGFGDVGNMGGIPAGMRSRCSMSQRMKRLRESGGEDRAERAVRNGLAFLAKHQIKEGPNAGAIGEDYKAGITGLALLAFLGHCETPESPKFGDVVVNATLYLMMRAKKNKGWISANDKRRTHDIYEHAIAVYALSELYTMTKEAGKPIPHLETVLKRAVSQLVKGQTKEGGWAYSNNPKGRDDGSISMWCFQALKAAHNTGRNFSRVEKALDKMVDNYIPNNQDSEGAFKYSMSHARGKSSLAAAGILGLQLWGKKDSKEYNKGIGYLTSKFANPYSAVSGGFPFYAPYYNTQVLFLHEGKEWENYNKKFQPKLLDAQNDDGSWLKPKSGGLAAADSQLMNSAWAILMLEVYYRYLPTTDKVKDLKIR